MPKRLWKMPSAKRLLKYGMTCLWIGLLSNLVSSPLHAIDDIADAHKQSPCEAEYAFVSSESPIFLEAFPLRKPHRLSTASICLRILKQDDDMLTLLGPDDDLLYLAMSPNQTTHTDNPSNDGWTVQNTPIIEIQQLPTEIDTKDVKSLVGLQFGIRMFQSNQDALGHPFPSVRLSSPLWLQSTWYRQYTSKVTSRISVGYQLVTQTLNSKNLIEHILTGDLELGIQVVDRIRLIAGYDLRWVLERGAISGVLPSRSLVRTGIEFDFNTTPTSKQHSTMLDALFVQIGPSLFIEHPNPHQAYRQGLERNSFAPLREDIVAGDGVTSHLEADVLASKSFLPSPGFFGHIDMIWPTQREQIRAIGFHAQLQHTWLIGPFYRTDAPSTSGTDTQLSAAFSVIFEGP